MKNTLYQGSLRGIKKKGRGIKKRSVKKYKYQLTERFSIMTPIKPPAKIISPFLRLSPTGRLTILMGYAYDGCSGPTIDDETNECACLVHDALCQLLREGYLPFSLHETYRLKIHSYLKQLCLEDGMGKFRARYYHWAVLKFNGTALQEAIAKQKTYTNHKTDALPKV